MHVIVTGGGGYVGFHIGWAFAQGGHQVTLLDLSPPDPEWQTTAPSALWDALPTGFWGSEKIEPGPLKFVKADVTSEATLTHLFQGVTGVIHTASYGVSGREQLRPHFNQQEEVNVGGTQAVIAAAIATKVRALVYTATYNVVFGGQEIRGGDETLPTFPLHAHTDHYSRTKAIAEMLVLTANGKCLDLQDKAFPPTTLRTCSLRINGVMGVAERRHTSRVLAALRSGLLVFTFGRKDSRVDFVGIQNAVQAHVKAMVALLQEQGLSSVLHRLSELAHTRAAKDDLQPETPSTMSNLTASSAATNMLSPALPSVLQNPQSQEQPFENKCQEEKQSTLNEVSSEQDIPTLVFQPKQQLTVNGFHTTQSTLDEVQLQQNITSNNSSPIPTNSPSLVSGNAFFICDGQPINHFEYFRPWFDGLGYDFPPWNLPLWLIMVLAHLQEITYVLVYKFLPFTPFVTPAEACKCGVAHYFSCRKAQTSFGYAPTRPNDQMQVVQYLREKYFNKENRWSLSLLSSSVKFALTALIISILLFFIFT